MSAPVSSDNTWDLRPGVRDTLPASASAAARMSSMVTGMVVFFRYRLPAAGVRTRVAAAFFKAAAVWLMRL